MARSRVVVLKEYEMHREREEIASNALVQRGDYEKVIWLYWLEKYFFSQGDKVLVRVGEDWRDGRVVCLEQTRPSDSQEDKEVVMVTVKVGNEDMVFNWADVVLRDGSKLLGCPVVSDHMRCVLEAFCSLPSPQTQNATEDQKNYLIIRMARWLEKNDPSLDPYFFHTSHTWRHCHWTDGLLYVILQCSIDAGDPFGIDVTGNGLGYSSSVKWFIDMELVNNAMGEDWLDGVEQLDYDDYFD